MKKEVVQTSENQSTDLVDDNIKKTELMFRKCIKNGILSEFELVKKFRYTFSFRLLMNEKKIYELSEVIDNQKETLGISHWKLS